MDDGEVPQQILVIGPDGKLPPSRLSELVEGQATSAEDLLKEVY